MSDEIQTTIKEVVENNDVVLFMKGTKETPNAGFLTLSLILYLS